MLLFWSLWLGFYYKITGLAGSSWRVGSCSSAYLPLPACRVLLKQNSSTKFWGTVSGLTLGCKMSETSFILERESSKCKSVLITPKINPYLISVCRNSFPGNTIICSALVPATFLQAVPLNWAKVKSFSLEGDSFFYKHLLLAELALMQVWPLLSWVWYLGTEPSAGSNYMKTSLMQTMEAAPACSVQAAPFFLWWDFQVLGIWHHESRCWRQSSWQGRATALELPMANWKCFPHACGCQGNSSCPGQPRI